MPAAAPPFTRVDEERLRALQTRIDHGDVLDEVQSMELAELKLRYHRFIEEGEQRLRGEVPVTPADCVSGEPSTAAPADALVWAGKAAYFWGSLVATAVPGYFGRVTGVTGDFLHWNWISDHLILGAIPVVTQIGGGGNHLEQLHRQLQDHKEELGLVVACLEQEELDGYGVNVIHFAKEEDWRSVFGVGVAYRCMPMLDTTADVPLDEVIATVNEMHHCIAEQKKTVYVHCKAGKGRSWMTMVCYLTTHGGLSYPKAIDLIASQRSQVSPSASQQSFALEFPVAFAKWQSLHEDSPATA